MADLKTLIGASLIGGAALASSSCAKDPEMHTINTYSGRIGSYQVVVNDVAPKGMETPTRRDITIYLGHRGTPIYRDEARLYSIDSEDTGADRLREKVVLTTDGKNGNRCVNVGGFEVGCREGDAEFARKMLDKAESIASTPFLLK